MISGSSTVEPISSLVAELFNETSPNVAISVDGPGTGDGFVLFCKGETDISDASRPIEPEEAKACKKAGIDYTELEIGVDGITVMTNPANSGVECLNLGDLYALFGPESTGIDTWSGADSLATQVGGTGGFPDAPLEITAPGEESGTYDSFIDLAGIEDTALAQGVPEDQAAALRSDYNGVARRQRDHHGDGELRQRPRVRRVRVRPGRPPTRSRRSRSTGAAAAWRRRPTRSPTAPTPSAGRCTST